MKITTVCLSFFSRNYLQFLNDRRNISIVSELAVLIPILHFSSGTKAVNVATEHSRNESDGPDLLLEIPFHLEHAPVGLDRNGSISLSFTMLFRVSK